MEKEAAAEAPLHMGGLREETLTLVEIDETRNGWILTEASSLRTLRAVRYITPFREGGSMPALVEAEDSALYVLKFSGAGQGPLALVAELIGGEIARSLGLSVPELVLLEVDSQLGRNEPDAEIRDLLRASIGTNLGMRFIEEATAFDLATGDHCNAETASAIVWLDAFLSNVDRTPRNPNLLMQRQQLYLIDHGAALYWQHQWESRERGALSGFPMIKDHILLPWASALDEAAAKAAAVLHEAELTRIFALVPDAWLARDGESAVSRRAEYVTLLTRRLQSTNFIEEAKAARAKLI
ncbi:MAG: HipA family kinase [Granulicella sp.]